MAPRKRTIGEIAALASPEWSEGQCGDFEEGRRLFNTGSFWHAHESWERVWLALGNTTADDAEIILRGLIQLAAALHLVGIGRMDGAVSNFRKSREKLRLAPAGFLGVDMDALLRFIDARLEMGDPSPPPAI